MAKLRLEQWLCLLVCLRMFSGIEGSTIGLTIIKSAVAKGAVCLDGTPPAYQFDQGFGDGANKWLVHMQAGGWCESVDNCIERKTSKYGLGSTNLMYPLNFTGILSNQQKLNPNFYNWNRVFMRYCDGSSFTGDVENVDPATNLHFRGARIFNVIVEELLAKGMNHASNVLLSGCSAGGLASVLYCDRFRALFPTSVRVKCIADAGYFPRVQDASGGYNFAKYYGHIVELHGSAKNLPASCTLKMSPEMCFYPQNVLPQVQTPIFVLNSVYDYWQVQNIWAPSEADPQGTWSACKTDISKCTQSQLGQLIGFRSQFLKPFLKKNLPSFAGFFINSCFTHCQSEDQLKWLGDPSSKLANKAISEAVGDWYYDRSKFQSIDNKQKLPHICVVDPPPPQLF